MNVENAIQEVADYYEYCLDDPTLSKVVEPWTIMTKQQDQKYYGDCEDFVLTVAYIACDSNLLKFLWHVFVLKTFRFYSVKTFYGSNHFVCNYKNSWFDNHTLKLVKGHINFINTTKHYSFVEHNRLFSILKLVSGYFYKVFKKHSSRQFLIPALVYLIVFLVTTGLCWGLGRLMLNTMF